jgi:hypothetical protein
MLSCDGCVEFLLAKCAASINFVDGYGNRVQHQNGLHIVCDRSWVISLMLLSLSRMVHVFCSLER